MKYISSFSLLLFLASCDVQPPMNDELRAAEIVLQHGGSEAALNVARSQLAANPRNVAALIVQGEAELAEGRKMQAQASFNRALEIEPDNTRALTGLGRIKLKRDPVDAEKLFYRATRVDPNNMDAKIDLGIALDEQGRFREAQKYYRDVIAASPESDRAIENLGLSIALNGDPEQALQVLRPLANSDRSSRSTRVNTAYIMILAGHYDEARMLLRKSMSSEEMESLFKKLDAHARRFQQSR